MKKHLSSLLAALCACAFSTVPLAVHAEESASFRLYNDTPNYANRDSGTASSFQLLEGGVTWLAAPLVGPSYQVVTAPPAAAQEPSGGEELPSGAGEEEGGGGGEGAGRRARPSSEGAPSGGEEGGTQHPSAPGTDDSGTEGPMTFGNVSFTIPGAKPLYDVGVRYPRGERLLGQLHYFYTVEEGPVYVRGAPASRAIALKDVLGILQGYTARQNHILILQAIASFTFLMSFQLFLSKLPHAVLEEVRCGSILIPFLKRKRKEKKPKGQQKPNSKKATDGKLTRTTFSCP